MALESALPRLMGSASLVIDLPTFVSPPREEFLGALPKHSVSDVGIVLYLRGITVSQMVANMVWTIRFLRKS
jgi:hypothetical protein